MSAFSELAKDAASLPAASVDPLRSLLDELAAQVPLTLRSLRRGEVLHVAGERLDALAIVAAGSFKTVLQLENGGEQIIGLHLRGDWIGLDAIADGRQRLSAVALEDASVHALPAGDLGAACGDSAALSATVVKSMQGTLDRQRDTWLAIAEAPAAERLPAFIDRWRLLLASHGIAGALMPMPLDLNGIANLVGLEPAAARASWRRCVHRRLLRGAGRRAIEIVDERRWQAYRRETPSRRSIASASSSRVNGLASSSAPGAASSSAVGR